MSKIAVCCPAFTGHVNPLRGLCGELQRRGHEITFVGWEETEPMLAGTGFGFELLDEANMADNIFAGYAEIISQRIGSKAFRYSMGFHAGLAESQIRDGARALEKVDPDMVLVDAVVPLIGSTAEILNIPFVTVSSALHQNWGNFDMPPFLMPTPFSRQLHSRIYNHFLYGLFSVLKGPVWRVTDRYRVQHGYRPARTPDEFFSNLAQITQCPQEFDFPRPLPGPFYHTGPFFSLDGRGQLQKEQAEISFPYDKLDGRPLIYASLGTLQNGIDTFYEKIAAACEGLNVQLVMSLGSPEAQPKQNFVGDPIVVPFAPQRELLSKAVLTITHAGMNTTLESIAAGTPMVAIPITNDQPGVSARIEWSSIGKSILPHKLTVPRLRAAIQRVLLDDDYEANVQAIQTAMQQTDGLNMAADIVEAAIRKSSNPATEEDSFAFAG